MQLETIANITTDKVNSNATLKTEQQNETVFGNAKCKSQVIQMTLAKQYFPMGLLPKLLRAHKIPVSNKANILGLKSKGLGGGAKVHLWGYGTQHLVGLRTEFSQTDVVGAEPQKLDTVGHVKNEKWASLVKYSRLPSLTSQ
jgi:hypothetical protein